MLPARPATAPATQEVWDVSPGQIVSHRMACATGPGTPR